MLVKLLILKDGMSKKLARLESIEKLIQKASSLKKAEDARMSQSFLKNILETTNNLLDIVDVDEDLDDWVDAKITKAHEALQDVYNFLKNYDKYAGLRVDKKPPKLFKPEKALQIAKELKTSDPDWDYRVKHDPKGKGYSFIEIYDESGEFIGTFNE